MTMATTTMSTAATTAGDRPGRSLEELVDRVFEALLGAAPEREESIARSVHEARRLRQQGDLDGALALLAAVDLKGVTERETRWAYARVARRGAAALRRAGHPALQPRQRASRRARPAPRRGARGAGRPGDALAPGKTVSRRSLRGLRPLAKGGS